MVSVAGPMMVMAMVMMVIAIMSGGVWAQAGGLSPGFYATTCPNVAAIARSTLRSEFANDPTAPAAMLRLLFHDCQVGGCDASILLDGGSDGTSELQSGSNLGIRRLDLIDAVKGQLEAECAGTVSCSDIIVLAAREAVSFAGGPEIEVPLGRLDGLDASQSAADSSLPAPTITVSRLLSEFGAMGMSTRESVAILGAHTLGASHCSNLVNRLYPFPDASVEPQFANDLRRQCPPVFPVDGVVPLDETSLAFDGAYYRGVVAGRGLLTIDAELGADPATAPIVQSFAASPADFFLTFSSAFVKLSSFRALAGNDNSGEVRFNCHSVNSAN